MSTTVILSTCTKSFNFFPLRIPFVFLAFRFVLSTHIQHHLQTSYRYTCIYIPHWFTILSFFFYSVHQQIYTLPALILIARLFSYLIHSIIVSKFTNSTGHQTLNTVIYICVDIYDTYMRDKCQIGHMQPVYIMAVVQ